MTERTPSPYDDLFAGTPGAADRLTAATAHLIGAVARPTGFGPRSTLSPAEVHRLVADIDVCPDEGEPLEQVVADLAARVWDHGVRPTDPRTVAHLHSPTLLTAAATEVAIATANQSMDSWDQAPAATSLELQLVAWLGRALGLPDGATGVLTAGGTSSNLLGLTLARARAAARLDHDVLRDGLPAEAARWRVLASADAHFSLQRATAQLGLGQRAVVPVATDPAGRLLPEALAQELARLEVDGLVPIAVVGTAGTTDLGAIDPLATVAEQARRAGAWFHVDAAVAGAFVLSDRLRPLLDGIARADSVTVDLHKLWWQPISASALVVADPAAFDALRTPSAYLDRDDDLPDAVNLVGRSLDTTRRFDAAKVVTSLRTTGRRRLGEMLEHLVALTAHAADVIDAEPRLELVAHPTTTMCVFRWVPTPAEEHRFDAAAVDRVNRDIQLALLADGRAVVGRTRIGGVTVLKFTLVNPTLQPHDLDVLVALVAAEGDALAEAEAL